MLLRFFFDSMLAHIAKIAPGGKGGSDFETLIVKLRL